MSVGRRGAGPLLGAAAVLLLITTARAGAHDASADDLIRRAEQAPSAYDFRGRVRVNWTTGVARHTLTVPVLASGGALSVGASSLAEGATRLQRRGGDWQLLWGARAPREGPVPEAKYTLALDRGPTVAGRSTTLVEASWHGRPRERLAFDDATGLLLRREQLDRGGRSTRAVEFVSISDPVTANHHSELPGPTSARDGRAPRPVTTWSSAYPAPRHAGDGFALVERYRRSDGVHQLFYSDGLYGVSVFEEQASLGSARLPPGGRWRDLAGRRVREYTTAGGAVLMWQSGDTVATCVSDAPRSDLVAVMRSFPSAPRHGVLRAVTDFVLAPFSWG